MLELRATMAGSTADEEFWAVARAVSCRGSPKNLTEVEARRPTQTSTDVAQQWITRDRTASALQAEREARLVGSRKKARFFNNIVIPQQGR